VIARPVTGWLGHASAGLRNSGDRADAWLAGALGALVYLGWLPLVLTVVPLPDAGDLGYIGVRLVTSGSFPFNVIALTLAGVAGFAALCGLAGLAEAVLYRSLAPNADPSPVAAAVLSGFTVLVVASLPAVAAALAFALGVAAVAPAEFQSPDLAAPMAMRVVLDLLPLAALLLAAVLVGQAFGAVALRLALAQRHQAILTAFRRAARDLARQPLRRCATALTAMLGDAVMLVLSVALLRVLWAPIATDLGRGLLAHPETILLLVGFVAIWLALLLAWGALHAAISAWWWLELGQEVDR
jgi:hypothetical protein